MGLLKFVASMAAASSSRRVPSAAKWKAPTAGSALPAAFNFSQAILCLYSVPDIPQSPGNYNWRPLPLHQCPHTLLSTTASSLQYGRHQDLVDFIALYGLCAFGHTNLSPSSKERVRTHQGENSPRNGQQPYRG